LSISNGKIFSSLIKVFRCQICDRTFAADDIIPLLKRYRLLPQLMRELVIDHEIADIPYTEDELIPLREQFTSPQHPEVEEEEVIRILRVQKFKQAKWQPHISSHFLKRKTQLDQMIYSLIRTRHEGLAYELYCRIQEKEQALCRSCHPRRRLRSPHRRPHGASRVRYLAPSICPVTGYPSG
jgi:hypothetical protein